MNCLNKVLVFCTSVTFLFAHANDNGTLKISTRYTDANTGQLNVTDSQIITLPNLSNLKVDEIYVSDPGMNKTLCVLGLKQAMEDATTNYHANKNNSEKIAATLSAKIETLFAQYKALNIEDKRLEEAFELAHKLAENIHSPYIHPKYIALAEEVPPTKIVTLPSPDNNILNGQWKTCTSDATWFVIQSCSDNTISTTQINNDHGTSVALSANGNTLADGDELSAWIFTRSGTVWSQSNKLNQGISVALSADGSTLAEGGLNSGTPATSPTIDYTDIEQYSYTPDQNLDSSGQIKYVSLSNDAVAPTQINTDRASLILTAGGAKDFNHLENLIKAGQVPVVENFEGFLSEFHLPLFNQRICEKLICVTPAVAIDASQKRMYVQVGMNSSTTAADFKRKPLNLALVIDVSGSMDDTDSTEKSRLEWAKEAALLTLNELNEQDIVSVVIFDDDASVLIEPSFYAQGNKKTLADKIRELQTHGSTNLEAGLRRGYELVARNLKPDYENRVILISDAGLNTGTTDDASLLRLVSDYALEKIGLTAIGIGENFNHAFINKIATTNGGNYIFAQSGKQLARSFANFKYLVSPVAYNIAADIDIRGIEAVLAKAYGIPFKKGEELKELVNIRTLFFSTAEAGGGALILEYDLPEMVITPVQNNQEATAKDSIAQQKQALACIDGSVLPDNNNQSEQIWIFV